MAQWMMPNDPSYSLRSVGDIRILVRQQNGGRGVFQLNSTGYYIISGALNGISRAEIELDLSSQYGVPTSIISSDIDDLLDAISGVSVAYDNRLDQAIHKVAAKHRVPVDGTLELTHACNLRCNHCYCVHCPTENTLSTKKVTKIIDEAAECGCLWLLLTGGEVLYRHDFEEIYRYASSKGMLVTVFTNALLVNNRIAALFEELPPYWLDISIYGASNASYQRLTRAKNGFTKLDRALRLLKDRGVSFSLKSCICQENVDEIEQMQAYAEQLDVEFRFDADIHERMDFTDIPIGTRLSPDEIAETEIKFLGYKPKEISDNVRNPYQNGLFYCEAGQTTFHIDPAGQLSVCGRYRDGAVSLFDNNFRDAWNKLRVIRQKDFDDNCNCRTCSLSEFCRTCPASELLKPEVREAVYCEPAKARKAALSTMYQ